MGPGKNGKYRSIKLLRLGLNVIVLVIMNRVLTTENVGSQEGRHCSSPSANTTAILPKTRK